MYIFGFVGGYFLVRWLAEKRKIHLPKDVLQEFISYLMIGVIFGGRLGYVLFYNLPFYLDNPLEALAIWHGGMSFHGGLLGALLMGWWFTKRRGLAFYPVADVCVVAVPIGLGLGRIGNFINGELYGRPSNAAWAMVFPEGGAVARHPSQLYEALLEGLVLFLVLRWLYRKGYYQGTVFWGLVAFYGLFRFLVEFVREPDAQIGFDLGPFTRGQLLSVPMLIVGTIMMITYARRHPPERVHRMRKSRAQ